MSDLSTQAEPPEDASARKSAKGSEQAGNSPRFAIAEAALIGLCARVLEKTSWSGCRRLGSLAGLTFYHAVPSRRRIAIENIRVAMPHLSEAAATRIARRAAQNLGMTFCESFHMGAASESELLEYVDLQGAEHLENALARGKGAILLSAHFGNWELMGGRVACEFPFSALARPNSNVGVQALMERARQSAGVHSISKWDSARPSVRALHEGRVLAILPDQRAGRGEGLLLPMFGQATRFYSSPAQLALVSGAPIVPCFGIRREPWLRDGRIVARVSPAFDVSREARGKEGRALAVEAGTRRVIEELEKVILEYSDQWWWLHRRWREREVSKGVQENVVGVSVTPAKI